MATDDKHPDPKDSGSENPPAGTDPDTGLPVDSGSGRDGFAFVDRDDDGSSGLVDLDYDEAFPGPKVSSGGDPPDPGYAAFADELDDPLADWPSPESRLEELPEMRGGETPQVTPPSAGKEEMAAVVAPAPGFETYATGEAATAFSDEEGSEFPEAEFFDDPPENEPAEPETSSTPMGITSVEKAGSAVVDRDEANESLESAVALEEDDTPASSFPSPSVDESSSRDAYLEDVDDDFPFEGIDGPEPEPEAEPQSEPEAQLETEWELEPKQEPEPESEDLLVDDFLNDLDDIDEEPETLPERSFQSGESVMHASEEDDERYAESVAESVLAAQEGLADARDREMTQHAVAGGLHQAPRGATKMESSGRHWVMIAVVAVALVLLAAGGYGVVQQRSTMQAEIRELQAQLATAVAPDEASEERERQRQMALQNESLGTEIAALEAENRALGEQIAGLESELEARRAAEESARAAAAAALAEAERTAAASQSSATAVAAPPAPAAAAGTWFVNFGSYAQRNVADQWAGRISVNQGRVSVQEAQAGGRTLFRVRVVGLGSRDAAERVATALEREYQLPKLWVGKS
ncbi:MAG: SPOR domain-containing protein [Pseudomonadota bacterium]